MRSMADFSTTCLLDFSRQSGIPALVGSLSETWELGFSRRSPDFRFGIYHVILSRKRLNPVCSKASTTTTAENILRASTTCYVRFVEVIQ